MIKLNMNINVKRKFIVNGKEYNSFDEIPESAKEAVKKGMGLQLDGAKPTKITFNGKEYGSVEEMPEDARQSYEKMLEVVEGGRTPRVTFGVERGRPTLDETEDREAIRSALVRDPPRVESFVSPRTLLLGVAAVVLVLLLYYLFYKR
jgi:hypothetical protein